MRWKLRGFGRVCLAIVLLTHNRGTAQTAPLTAAPPSSPSTTEYSLDGLISVGLSRNPTLAQAGFAVENARGRALQAGLYPNPLIEVRGDEISDRTGPGGIWSAPTVAQEIVTADKLKLDRAAIDREADQAALALQNQRYVLMSEIRAAYYVVLTLERRIDILRQLVDLADQSVEQTEKLLKARQVARLDLVQLEVQAEQFRAELEAAQQELPAAFRRLAAVVGVSDLPAGRLQGELGGELPQYELDRVLAYVLAIHPDLAAARVGVEQAQLRLRRAEVEPIPNVTLATGYIRQNQNKSDDWQIGVSFPVPTWNRNQGGIQAARAALGTAIQEVGRVQNDLTDQIATAYRVFAAARRRAERYRHAIIPRSEETFRLSMQAYQGGQFEYLRVLEAQRSLAQATLEYVRVLGEAWQAASTISGLTLEEHWPPVPPVHQEPEPSPLPDLKGLPPPRAVPRIEEMRRTEGLRPLVAGLLRDSGS